MAADNVSITVEQYEDWATVPNATKYRVTQVINSTTPKIGERLTKAQVDELISTLGFRVTIKAEK